MVRCPIGQSGEVPDCDPFLGIDHFGPVEYGPGEAIGAPDHPHRGFETVTYMVEGSSQHKDSAGNSGLLKEGWVQWMTAGSGEKSLSVTSAKYAKFQKQLLRPIEFSLAKIPDSEQFGFQN